MREVVDDVEAALKVAREVVRDVAEVAREAAALWQAQGCGARDFVLLLPGGDAGLNDRIRAAVAVTLGGRRGAVVEGRDARDLLALYSLYAFTDKLIVGSFDLPHGRKLRNLLDSGTADEETLINDVILGVM
jgi:hypothetical protein